MIESTAATNFRDQSPDFNTRNTLFEEDPNVRNMWSLPKREPHYGSSSNNAKDARSNMLVSDNISEHPSEYEQSFKQDGRVPVQEEIKSRSESVDTSHDSADFSEFGENRLQDQKRKLDIAIEDNDDIKPIQISHSTSPLHSTNNAAPTN